MADKNYTSPNNVAVAPVPTIRIDPTTGLPAIPMLGNVDALLMTHTAAAAGAVSVDQTNSNGRGVQIGINVSAITGVTAAITAIIEGRDMASGVYYTLFASAAIAAAGFTLLTLYPGSLAVANLVTNQILPRTWRLRTVISGASPSVTATVGASVIV